MDRLFLSGVGLGGSPTVVAGGDGLDSYFCLAAATATATATAEGFLRDVQEVDLDSLFELLLAL